ncbi:MAG TPA: phosphoadenosine phosphosulfate reductase family protein [Gemmata sp.]
MSIFSDTIAKLREAAAEDSSCVVGFSGGKDSLVCLDLAVRSFKRVSAYHMYMIPGLVCVEAALAAARARWDVEIVQFPHWELRRSLENGVYCVSPLTRDLTQQWTMGDIYQLARAQTRSRWVLHGAKNSDSVWRRRTLAAMKQPDVIHPLKHWGKRDVLAYLKARDIPVPDAAKGNATGIDLKSSSLLWLHDKHPADFDKLCELFPFARAVVYRRKFYGESDA